MVNKYFTLVDESYLVMGVMSLIPWRTGVNMREFAYYDTELFESTRQVPDLQGKQINAVQNLGARWVRFFGSHRAYSTAQCIDQIGQALENLHAAGISAIVCLDDALGTSNFCVKDTQQWHTEGNLLHIHKSYWHGSYEDPYLKHVEAVVSHFKTLNQVIIWELGNEYALHPQEGLTDADGEAFLKFVKTASGVIKQSSNNNPNQLVSIGLINSRQVSPRPDDQSYSLSFAKELYKPVDVVSLHFYRQPGSDEEPNSINDIEAARVSEKPLPIYVGEIGVHNSIPSRIDYFQEKIAEWRSKNNVNVFAVMPWQFSLSYMPWAIGITDDYAFAQTQTAGQQEFEDLLKVFKSFSVNEPVTITQDIVVENHEESQSMNDNAQIVALSTILFFQVKTRTRIRGSAGLNAAVLDRVLNEGDTIQVEASSRTEQDNYVWWKHSLGWSAERTADGAVRPEILMERFVPTEAIQLPTANGRRIERPSFFESQPVSLDNTVWLQYFGNTIFAHNLMLDRDPSRQKLYFYCQGLHGGIDFGNEALPDVVAGVHGTVQTVHRGSTTYGPNYVEIKLGKYTVIYGHVYNIPDAIQTGVNVDPSTKVAEIAPGGPQGSPHLHLEVRYSNTWIINPLLFMAEDMWTMLIGKFSRYDKHFYKDQTWTQWLTPLDQPVLRLSNPADAIILGPRGASG